MFPGFTELSDSKKNWWCGYFWGPCVSFVVTNEFSVSHKNYFQDRCLIIHTLLFSVLNLFLTQWITAILSKGCKSDNFESHNSLKLSFTNTHGHCSNFADCESFLEWNSLKILALCETNLDDLIDSADFSVKGYIHLIWKDSTTHMYHFAVRVKEGLCFARDLYLENPVDS